MKIPEPLNDTKALIYKALESNQGGHRSHLGASQIGHKCERFLWLSFRWAFASHFPGRVLRLFRRGHDEERYFVDDLRMIGVDIYDADENGKQFGFVDGHFGGSYDGIIESGLPEAPTKRHIAEFKTHSLKSFKDLSKGVKESKPMHWAQMQVYMGRSGIDRAFYMAVCKDDDQLYTERVKFDAEAFEKLEAKAKRIIASDRMLEPISTNPEWYECKFCNGYSICFYGAEVERNCRTCDYSLAADNGTWTCARWESVIPTDAQRVGCDEYKKHGDM